MNNSKEKKPEEIIIDSLLKGENPVNTNPELFHTQNTRGWRKNILKVAVPSETTRSGKEVVYDPYALIEQIEAIISQSNDEVIMEILKHDFNKDGRYSVPIEFLDELADYLRSLLSAKSIK